MNQLLLTNAQIVFPGECVRKGSLLIKDGSIAKINPRNPANSIPTLDCEGKLLTPGLIDLHTHGIHQSCYHFTSTLEEFSKGLELVLQYGTTCLLPTIVPSKNPELLKPLANLLKNLPKGGRATVPGYHIEGPFVALGGAACPTLAGDVKLLDKFLDACGDQVSVMSISPDQKNILPVIRRLVTMGVTPFITHTRANVEQTEAAIEAGARHATHFYDVFPAPEETEPGVRPVGSVEAILADPRVSVDFIADGVHVHPTAIRAALAAKGWSKIILITDSNIGAGLPKGEYQTPWGFKVAVKPGDAARHSTKGFLAGSALTSDLGMKNLLKWLPIPADQVWAMGTLNPAELMGLKNKGRIAVGADADLVLWDKNLKALNTWVNGELVFARKDKP